MFLLTEMMESPDRVTLIAGIQRRNTTFAVFGDPTAKSVNFTTKMNIFITVNNPR